MDIRSRAFWSGTITFGLVSVPVALYPANRRSRVALRMLTPDGVPLRRRYYCPKEDRAVERNEIVRGYEVSEGNYVTVTDEELESLDPEKSREIDLRRFVPVEQIDPVFFDRAYFLIPTGDVTKPYQLLAETMEKKGRAGIATFVIRGKEYLVAILAEKGFLRAETLRFEDEVRPPEDIGSDLTEEVDQTGLANMTEAIRSVTAGELDLEELKDTDTRNLLELIEKKTPTAKVQPIPTETDDDEDSGGKIIDIMEALKRQLQKSPGENESETTPPEDLQRQSKQSLYEKAKVMNIPGRSTMTKEELATAIRKTSAGGKKSYRHGPFKIQSPP